MAKDNFSGQLSPPLWVMGIELNPARQGCTEGLFTYWSISHWPKNVFFLLFFNFICNSMHIRVTVGGYLCMNDNIVQIRVSDPLEMELQAVANSLIQMLETELGPSMRASALVTDEPSL